MVQAKAKPETTEEQPKPEPPRPKWKQRKFIILVLIVVLLVCGLVFAGFKSFKKAKPDNSHESNIGIKAEDSEAVKAGKELSGGQCEGEGVPAKLSKPPMDQDDFAIVIPYGLMVGDHVTPIDHQYFSPADYNSPRDAYAVYAMGDGHITSIGLREKPEGGHAGGNEYRMVFTQTCTFHYYYDLVTSLSPDLNRAFDESRRGNFYTQNSFNFEVKAGQLIGYIGGRTLDFAVWDTTKPLKGFTKPENYKAESWKLYTADPLNYYSDELKSLVLIRYARDVEPVSGKIDYDQDGRLIGNWFLEGTNGYAGRTEAGGPGAHLTHLSFSPEHLDPTHFVISIGSWDNGTQFVAKGNAPWPADVTVTSGLVKYELLEISYKTADGSFWDRKSPAKGIKVVEGNFIKGTVLVQVLDGGKIKFESFKGKRASQVSGFTSAASVYTR